VAALGVVAWHYWKLRAVLLRLTSRRRLPPPRGAGVWNELDRLLHRGQADMRERKRRLVEMLRAYRAVAAALPDAVVVIERNSQSVQWFNQAATRLLGLRYPDDIGPRSASGSSRCRSRAGWPPGAVRNPCSTRPRRWTRQRACTCA
jgi:two-component system, OmpR family, phosphate regulon sensor histidine kinase PhoR